MVMGPVPPGMGVTAPATACTPSKSTSPTIPAAVREIPTSTTAAPGRTQSAVTRPAIPAAATMMSARRQSPAKSAVRLWASVTVASIPLRPSSSTCGSPTRVERPITTARRPEVSTP